jgi:hypothetical protein
VILAAIVISMMLHHSLATHRATVDDTEADPFLEERMEERSEDYYADYLNPSGGGEAAVYTTPPLSPSTNLFVDTCWNDSKVDEDVCAIFRCEGRAQNDRTCRKRGAGHGDDRSQICPVHANGSSFVRCAKGCEAYCHVGCFDQVTRKAISRDGSWTCGRCPPQSGGACVPLSLAAAGDADSSQKDVGSKSSIETIEDRCFESFTVLHSHMRILGFTQITSHKNSKGEKISIIWRCPECLSTFTAKRCSSDIEKWKARPTSHLPTCSEYSEVDVLADSKHIMKQHEFIKKPGLLEFIETLGACGEVRSDQIARAVAKHFDGAIVEPNLLYRTAKKAQEKHFGTTTSDVMALQELAQRIVDGDGVLEFVYGVCLSRTHRIFAICLWCPHPSSALHLHFICHSCVWCRHSPHIVFFCNLFVVSTPVFCTTFAIRVCGVDTRLTSYFLQFVCGVHTRLLHFICHSCVWCRHSPHIVFFANCLWCPHPSSALYLPLVCLV